MQKPSILPAIWDVPESFRKRLGRDPGRQRSMFSDGHLLIVLHVPPGPEDMERQGRFFWRQPDGTWNSNSKASGIHALRSHLEQYESLIEKLEKADFDAGDAEDYFSVIYQVTPVTRSARNMHQALQQAREFCPDDLDLINIRDQSYKIERTSELLHQDARQSMEFEVARQAEKQAKSSHQMSVAAHRFNVLAAFFFPIVTLSGIFGMNLMHGWEDEPGPIPLFGVLLGGLLIGFFLKSWVTRSESSRGT